jgi:hypothetical protein
VAAITTGIDLGVNFTGTNTELVNQMMYQDGGSTATGGTVDGTVTGDGLELIIGGGASLTKSTTAPNLNVITGALAAGEKFLLIVEGVIIVTVSGDFELWAASDVAASAITIYPGSSVLVQAM